MIELASPDRGNSPLVGIDECSFTTGKGWEIWNLLRELLAWADVVAVINLRVWRHISSQAVRL